MLFLKCCILGFCSLVRITLTLAVVVAVVLDFSFLPRCQPYHSRLFSYLSLKYCTLLVLSLTLSLFAFVSSVLAKLSLVL